MKIQTALDWNNIGDELSCSLKSIKYNPDLHKLYQNIDKMVDDLSKLEVSFRRIHKTELLQNKIDEINNAIDYLNKLILMAKLMQ